MKKAGIVLIVLSIGVFLISFLYIISEMQYGSYAADLFWAYIAASIAGGTLFYGVILFGFGSLAERLELANKFLMDIRNQGSAVNAQVHWQAPNGDRAPEAGTWRHPDAKAPPAA